ncbi:hypothetical protein DKX38_027905 [Salix brachista]|uniref:Uncharacterized protein n=1 Tax=Salix brachista TaxID=2182728 RepID=A0A5N5J483_9ROSI|nr:hypothetical protein DKX38_027905 [Salix brachista]
MGAEKKGETCREEGRDERRAEKKGEAKDLRRNDTVQTRLRLSPPLLFLVLAVHPNLPFSGMAMAMKRQRVLMAISSSSASILFGIPSQRSLTEMGRMIEIMCTRGYTITINDSFSKLFTIIMFDAKGRRQQTLAWVIVLTRLFQAGKLTSIRRLLFLHCSDIVEMASYAPLLMNCNDRSTAVLRIIGCENSSEFNGATLFDAKLQTNSSTLVSSAITRQNSNGETYPKLKVVFQQLVSPLVEQFDRTDPWSRKTAQETFTYPPKDLGDEDSEALLACADEVHKILPHKSLGNSSSRRFGADSKIEARRN